MIDHLSFKTVKKVASGDIAPREYVIGLTFSPTIFKFAFVILAAFNCHTEAVAFF